MEFGLQSGCLRRLMCQVLQDDKAGLLEDKTCRPVGIGMARSRSGKPASCFASKHSRLPAATSVLACFHPTYLA